jgi:hypothetical protein
MSQPAQVMWSMKQRSEGDGFYECLQSELRSLFTMPDAIRTKDLFSKWYHQHIGDEASMARASSLKELESLFEGHIKIIIEAGDEFIQSPVSATDVSYIIRMQYIDGVYSSARHKRGNPLLGGLDGLEFWLTNLKAQLPARLENSCLFIVGTHLDEAPGTPRDRQDLVLNLVERLDITWPVRVFEVSCYPIETEVDPLPGVREFRDELLDTIKKLPHMGEEIPRSYLEVLRTCQVLASERQQSGLRLFCFLVRLI